MVGAEKRGNGFRYVPLKGAHFFKEIDSEEKARQWAWKARFGGREFECPQCRGNEYYQHKAPAEVRTCKNRNCLKQVRLRAGTVFQDSKIPMLTWIRAIYFVMQSKRGISALELKRLLGMSSYGTTWSILHKIRQALRQRDAQYKLSNIIELDSAFFGKKITNNQRRVLVAVEAKEWVDDKKRLKSGAGFAKVVAVIGNSRDHVKDLVDNEVTKGSVIYTDAEIGFVKLRDSGKLHAEIRHSATGSTKEESERWLPWVHKFISNAKTWVLGTHHGVEAKYLTRYLGEYTYRFNRRHDPDSLFHRALTACATASPWPAHVLFG